MSMAGKKRKFELDDDEDHQQLHVSNKKHTLDSDEEDSDDYEKEELHDSDVEGEEEGIAGIRDEVKITPFNMREELTEGHFDKDGTYHWDKNAEIRDNWLDNIDWVKVDADKRYLDPQQMDDSNDDSLTKPPDAFNEGRSYAQILNFMQPNETVQKTLQRLGKDRVKISTAERLRRKKLGIIDEAGEKITKFTELTNEILTRTGNMDVYQMTTEAIQKKVTNMPGTSKNSNGAGCSSGSTADPFDMYADDFEEKEKQHLESTKENENKYIKFSIEESKEEEDVNNVLQWEYKWKQEDTEIQGPYTTEQMLKWSEEGFFKSGVYVRKVSEGGNFYSSNRIDFDLYL